jgi:hypothetical protein
MDRRKQTLGKKSLGNGDEKEIEKKKKEKMTKRKCRLTGYRGLLFMSERAEEDGLEDGTWSWF